MALLKSKKHIQLLPEELKWTCNPKELDFSISKDLKPIEGILGQERAIKALQIGVSMKSHGYNIFITGLSGTGKFSTVKKMLETINPDCDNLFDYAYVNNFEDEDRPISLKFPAGEAVKFKKELAGTIKFLQENIPGVMESDYFIKRKKKIITEYTDAQQNLLNAFEQKLAKENFALGQLKVGEMVRPEILFVFEKQSYFISQLDELVAKNKITKQKSQAIISRYTDFQEALQIIFRKSLQLNQSFKEKIKNLETLVVKDIIQTSFSDLKEKFQDEKVQKFIADVIENILQNLEVFQGSKPIKEETSAGIIVDYLKEYEVNIVLDNCKLTSCPVIVETSPTFTNLFGAIEKYSDGSGNWLADFTRIKAGSLLRANGGYIIINAMDAFSEPGVWRTLKRVMLYGILEIQDLANSVYSFPSALKPEPIEINTKIIFIGNNYIYSLLSENEDDFNKIFKIKAEFDYEIKRNDHILSDYAKVIKKLIRDEKLLEFDSDAIARLIEYGARYAGEKNKLTTRFAYIGDLIREACFWARDVNARVVTAYNVDQAFESSRERHAMYEDKLSEMIKDGTILIDTVGERIGQINGLAVYGSNHLSFGKPTRITASVSLGNGNIINVEREAGLSGNTHNKGMLIISGYFRETFGRKFPLSFSASIVFEQGYGMIDGDSASITEICALISSITEIPIRQSFAITGSVNQKGDIQPIGGVNEKIEGFFDVCNAKGLTGKHGVIIPQQNVKDLMLKDAVIQAVKENKFHIFAVSKVEEAVELLTGFKAGRRNQNKDFGINTVFYLVEKKLKEMQMLLKASKEKLKTKSRRVVKKNK
ncbi:MAG: peptidase [Ignavibacteriales bacterium CG_4_9_14_3_um_filter_34_10]|nr:MAG: peptidase [Ignavibacteriales bacterium CG_4_9_14_3_um_filter_34_10]